MATTTKTLIEAMLDAQRDFPEIHTTTPGQAGGAKYLYASLPDILEKVLPVLQKHGLLMTQQPVEHNGDVWLQTTISHVSGESQTGMVPLPLPQNWQQWGSAVTYARRYSLTAMLGIAPDADDDASNAQGYAQDARRGASSGQQGARNLANAVKCPEHGLPWSRTSRGTNAHPIKDDAGTLLGWCDQEKWEAANAEQGALA